LDGILDSVSGGRIVSNDVITQDIIQADVVTTLSPIALAHRSNSELTFLQSSDDIVGSRGFRALDAILLSDIAEEAPSSTVVSGSITVLDSIFTHGNRSNALINEGSDNHSHGGRTAGRVGISLRVIVVSGESLRTPTRITLSVVDNISRLGGNFSRTRSSIETATRERSNIVRILSRQVIRADPVAARQLSPVARFLADRDLSTFRKSRANLRVVSSRSRTLVERRGSNIVSSARATIVIVIVIIIIVVVIGGRSLLDVVNRDPLVFSDLSPRTTDSDDTDRGVLLQGLDDGVIGPFTLAHVEGTGGSDVVSASTDT